MPFKTPQNFRAAPARVSSPEAITVSGGIALLAEAPADPSVYAIIVSIAGNVRTRVDVAPAAGQFRILTQTLPGPTTEWLPVLQLHSSDEGLSGTADYYGTGTILTSQFFQMLLAFLTPLTGVENAGVLPSPSLDVTQRGRPGDVAFLLDGTAFFSDGTAWNPFASGTAPSSSLTMGTLMAMALDAGYVGPSFTDSIPDFSSAFAATMDASFAGALEWIGDMTIAQVLGMTSDATQDEVGSITVAQTLGMTMDAVLALVGSPLDFAATFGATLDGVWAAASGTAVSDNFNRANGGLGANWGHFWRATGTADVSINSNAVIGPAAPASASWISNAFAANQYAEAQVAAPGTGSTSALVGGIIAAVRMQPDGANGYYVGSNDWGGKGPSGCEVVLGKLVAGTPFLLARYSTTVGWSTGKVLRIEVTGSGSLVVKWAASHGGTYTQILAFTDTNTGSVGPFASGAAGLCGFGGQADDFYGGDL